MLRLLIAAAVFSATLIACDLPTNGERSSSPPTFDFSFPSADWGSSWNTITTSRGTVRISGRAYDSTGVAAVAYRLPGGASVPMSLEEGDGYWRFDEEIEVPDGIYPLFVTAVDDQGNRSDPVEFTVRATSATVEMQPFVTIIAREGEYGRIDSMRLTGTAQGVERLRYELIMWIDGPGSVNFSSPIALAPDGSFEAEVETGAAHWNQISIVGEDALGIPVSTVWREYSLYFSAPEVEIEPGPAERVVDPETGRLELDLTIDAHSHLIDAFEVQVDDEGWEPIDIPGNRPSLEVQWSPVLTRDTSNLAVRAVSTGGGTRIVRFQVPAY